MQLLLALLSIVAVMLTASDTSAAEMTRAEVEATLQAPSGGQGANFIGRSLAGLDLQIAERRPANRHAEPAAGGIERHMDGVDAQPGAHGSRRLDTDQPKPFGPINGAGCHVNELRRGDELLA